METWLKTKTAGLPRWAWLAGLSSAVILGLYLRSRSNASEEELGPEEEFAAGEGSLGEYASASEGGLAGAGLVGPVSSQNVPVQTPYIPEGFTEMFGSLTELIHEQGETNRELAQLAIEGRGGSPPEPGYHETVEPASSPAPSSPAPKSGPTCSSGDVATLKKAKNEIDRLQGEIDQLQNNINAHPKAKQVNEWRANIQNKRSNVEDWHNKAQAIRNKPGCGSVAV